MDLIVHLEKFKEADVHKQRKFRKRKIDIPGTISIHGRIINVYGQYLPGSPRKKKNRCSIRVKEDTKANRVIRFEEGLNKISISVPEHIEHSFAFPMKIGCCLAGGDWEEYLPIIQKFAADHPHWKISIYDNSAPIIQSENFICTTNQAEADAELDQVSDKEDRDLIKEVRKKRKAKKRITKNSVGNAEMNLCAEEWLMHMEHEIAIAKWIGSQKESMLLSLGPGKNQCMQDLSVHDQLTVSQKGEFCTDAPFTDNPATLETLVEEQLDNSQHQDNLTENIHFEKMMNRISVTNFQI